MRKLLFAVSVLFIHQGKSQIINTIVGGAPIGSGIPATQAHLSSQGITVDVNGNVFIADGTNNVVRKVSVSGIITTIAGTGTQGYSGNNGLATLAQLDNPYDVAVDAFGNIYISDLNNHAIRKVSASGIITTVAGTGPTFSPTYTGDGGPATAATLNKPSGLAIDNAGHLLICDYGNNCIRKISSGIISTIAGKGPSYGGWSGDGGKADTCRLFYPRGVATDTKGNIYIADYQNSVIRKIDINNIISTIAGNALMGYGYYGGDGGPATAAILDYPTDVAVDQLGNVYIADNNDNRVRKIDTLGIIDIVAGNCPGGGNQGSYSGDGGLAINAGLSTPQAVALNASGNLFISDVGNNLIRKINNAGIINTVAGSRPASNISGTLATLSNPVGITRTPDGNLYMCDENNYIIRKYLSSSGIITTWDSIEGAGLIPCSGTPIATPHFVVADSLGNLYVSISANGYAIIKVTPSKTHTLFAGNTCYGHNTGYCGDGGPADSIVIKAFGSPPALAIDKIGNIYFTDNHRVRKIDPAGIVTNFAGDTLQGFSGDGGPATAAKLNNVTSVAADPFGNVYIVDSWNNRIRMVNSSGIISTLAGSIYTGYHGDGGRADTSWLNNPISVTADASGNVYIADQFGNVIRQVSSSGYISTIVGTTAGFSGDGGSALFSKINTVSSLAVDPSGSCFYISDTKNNRLRLVSNIPTPSICMVSVDSLSQNNIVYWDKSSYYNVDSFIVYREINASPSTYGRIGSISADSLSLFVDTTRSLYSINGDPNITTYRYKLKYKDKFNNFSSLSDYHNSIYVNNLGSSFTWNAYDIQNNPNPVSYYTLMRDNNATGVWTTVGTTAGSQTSLNDPQYATYQSSANWKIETIWGINCTPSLREGHNSIQGAVVKSRSNVRNNRTTGISKLNSSEIKIYPNPANNELTISVSKNYNNCKIEIGNTLGETLKLVTATNIENKIDISEFSNGVYFIKVISNGNSTLQKIVVQH